MRYETLFNKPKLVAVVGEANSAKSNLLYDIVLKLQESSTFSLYTYGLKEYLPHEKKFHSVRELENIENSIIIIDEFMSLFDLDNRKQKRMIENTLRLIFHRNNILILSGLPENYKKFLSAKVDIVFYKRCSLMDFINGSRLKNVCSGYKGSELGSEVLQIDNGSVLIFDGMHYHKRTVDYHKQYDTKAKNVPIFRKEGINVPKNVPKKDQIMCKKRSKKVQQ